MRTRCTGSDGYWERPCAVQKQLRIISNFIGIRSSSWGCPLVCPGGGQESPSAMWGDGNVGQEVKYQ